jgi:CRP-like cAMP-binding protein
MDDGPKTAEHVSSFTINGTTHDPQVQDHLLQRSSLAKADPEFRQALLALAGPRSYATGAPIYHAGDTRRDFFLVAKGVVALHSRFTHPDATMLHMVHAGECFGSVPALFGHTRLATASARTPVEVLRVPGVDLQAMLQRRPEWFVELGRDQKNTRALI